MAHKHIIEHLLSSGLKNTKARREIIDILYHSKDLLSAEDLYQALLLKKANINLSTVYRTLETLTEKQILNRISLENESKNLYEYNAKKHHHFLICKTCNRVIPIYHCPLHDYEQRLAKDYDFEITDHKIEFYGICKACREKSLS